MKITWFGGSTFRLYVGGVIFVTDIERAPANIDRRELGAGADHRIDLSDGLVEFPYLDLENWRPRRQSRLIDMPAEQIAELYTISGEGLFIDEPQEGPVIVAPANQTAWGRFAEGAVVVLYGPPKTIAEGVRSLVASARPKLVALATEGLNDLQFQAVAACCDGCAVQVLEPGLSVEA